MIKKIIGFVPFINKKVRTVTIKLEGNNEDQLKDAFQAAIAAINRGSADKDMHVSADQAGGYSYEATTKTN